MSPFKDASPRQQELGRALQGLRKAAGLSQSQLGERLGVVQATVSRMETGRGSLPSPELLDRWAEVTRASTQQWVDLHQKLEAAATEVIPWRGRPQQLAQSQRETAAAEASSGLVRGYHPVLVHSLLQVPAYAEVSYRPRAQLFGLSDAEVDAAVRERIAKQVILTREGHRFEFILTEASLRFRFVPREVQAAQVARIAQVAKMPNVLVGVIPLEIEVPVFAWHGFSGFLERDGTEDLVLVETLTADVPVRMSVDLARYDQAFSQLLAASVTGEEVVALLERVAAEVQEAR